MAFRRGVYVSNYDVYADPARLLAVAEAAVAGGWEGFFIWDHVWFRHNKPVCDAWVALAAVASRFPSLVVGPLVTPLARRRPWNVAREAATLHAIARECVLGVGLGVDVEFEVFEGEDPTDATRHDRGDALDEALDVLDRLWSGEDAARGGERYPIRPLREGDGATVPVRFTPVPDPPIRLWGAARLGSPDRPYRRAAERLDGIVPVRDKYEPGRSVTAEEFERVAERVGTFRTGDDPFDLVLISRSLGTDPPDVDRLASAGMTWWLEDLHHGGIDPDEALQHLAAGPVF